MTLTGSNGNATVNPNGGVVELNGNLSGPGGLNLTGSGSVHLGGTNTYQGGTHNLGPCTLGVFNPNGLSGYNVASSIQVDGGATLDLSLGGTGWAATDVSTLLTYNGGGFAPGSILGLDTTSGAATYTSSISGNMGLTKLGPNDLMLGGANTYTGPTTISQGSLTFAGSNTFSGNTSITSGTLNLSSGGALQTTSGITVDTGGGISLATNALLSTTDTEYIGNSSTGTLAQSGGTNNIGNVLHVGYNAGSSGTYTLSGGVLAMTNTTMYTNYGQPGGPCEYVGYSGTGNFVQSAGTNSICNDLVLGYNVGSSGTYALTGGTLALTNVNNDSSEYIGYNGTGNFSQTGGLNNVCYELYLGNAGSGTYSLSGGSLSAGDCEYIGNGGNATFTQSSGLNTVCNELYVGNGGSGTYSLGGGSLSVGDCEYVGCNGNATLTQSGGVNNVYNELFVGNGGSGTYNLSGGSLSPGGGEFIGYDDAGTFTQSGGTNNASMGLVVADGYRIAATYSLTGGSLSAGQEHVGYSGTGTFSQTGGTNSASNLYLGPGGGSQVGSIGTYNLSGPGLLSCSGSEVLGYSFTSGTGAFTQSGGTNTASSLYVGFCGGSTGTYNLGTGLLSVGGGGEYVGYSGMGTFTQTGGTNSVSNLDLGLNSGRGTYNLCGGSLSASAEVLGYSYFAGTGAFSQSGGTNSVSNLYLAQSGTGTYTLNSGALSASTEYVGEGGNGVANGTFTQSGGTNAVSSNLSIGYNWETTTGMYNLSGSGLLSCTGTEGLGYQGTGTFTSRAARTWLTIYSRLLGQRNL